MSAAVLREAYRDILSTARRFTRSDADARDVAQDVLEIAIEHGVDDWSSPERRAWLRGVARRHAAFVARGELRRRRRELEADAGGMASNAWTWQPTFLASLPRSLRSVATLISADLCSVEIRWLLQLTDTALRQRLTGLRRALKTHAAPPTLPASGLSGSFGPLRPQVLALLRRRGGRAVATQDPDGHVIFLRIDAHTAGLSGNR